MEIKTIKFTNGDEIIGRFVGVDSNSNTCEIEKPRGLLPQRMGDGQVGIAFVPWIISNPDATVSINMDAIAAMLDSSKEIGDAYLSQTSGLQLVTG